jgi:hypothetical protein
MGYTRCPRCNCVIKQDPSGHYVTYAGLCSTCKVEHSKEMAENSGKGLFGGSGSSRSRGHSGGGEDDDGSSSWGLGDVAVLGLSMLILLGFFSCCCGGFGGRHKTDDSSGIRSEESAGSRHSG